MSKIKAILQKNGRIDYDKWIIFTPSGLDTAASAIEKVHDEEMEDFIEWVGNNYVKLHKVWVHRYASQTNPENFVTYAQLREIFLRQEKIRTDFINSSR